jgi:hypothetical protein
MTGTALLDVRLPPDGGACPYLQLFDPERQRWYGIDDEWWDGPTRGRGLGPAIPRDALG